MTQVIIALPVLIIAVIIDIREFKIPNYLSIYLMGAGVLFNLYQSPSMFIHSILGVGAVFIVFIFPYFIKIIGAGDVKLMMALGSVYGIVHIWLLLFYILFSGTVISAIYLVLRGRLLSGVNEVIKETLFAVSSRQVNTMRTKNQGIPTKKQLPYSIAILFGYMLFIAKEVI